MDFQDREMHTYNFGTWNVQGLTEKKKETFTEIERENENLVVLTETKLRGSGQEEHGKYIHLYSGVKTGHARAGVSIFIKKDLGRITKWEAVNERLITAKLNIHGQKVIVIGVYWVDDSATPYIKDRFQSDFKNELKKVKREHELIILGDFNSKVGISTTSKIVGKFGDKEINNNGRRLIDVCEEFKLKIQNTFFDHEDIHKYTWHHKRNSSKSLIDFCITRQETTLQVHDILACRWLECGTDHIFLEATISFPIIKGNENNEYIVEEEAFEMIKYKTYLLHSQTFRNSYNEYLDSFINTSTERSTKEMYCHLKKGIHSAATHVLGIQDKDVFGEFLWDQELLQLRARRLNIMSDSKIESLSDRTIFHSPFDKYKNEVWKNICETIDKAEKNKRSKTAWRILEEVLNKRDENLTHYLPSENFCKNLFKNNRIDVKEFETKKIDKKENTYKIDPDQTLQIKVEDVMKALDELDDDKGPVPDGLSLQLLRNSSFKSKYILANLIQDIFNGKEIPPEIDESYISNIVKIKNREKYAIEDGIQVHSIMRIMCFILNEMLQKVISLKNFSLNVRQLTHLDAIFTLRLLLQKVAEKQNPPLHLAFVDLKQAYFGVQHLKLFKTLEKYGISKTLIAVLEHLFKSNTLRVVGTNKLSDQYILDKGLIEQCVLGPTLLKMYIQESIIAWSDENSRNGITIDNRILTYIISNDKIIIVAQNHTSLETMILNLKHRLKSLGLHISLKNLKYLGNEKLTFGKTTIQGENVIDYDGSCLELDGRNWEEVSHRILETKNAIGYLHPVVRDECVSMKIKRKIFNIIIRSILMNGCETWTLTDDLKGNINLVEMNYWKWCCENHTKKYTSQQLRTVMNIKYTCFDIFMLRKAAWYTIVKQMNLDKWPVWILNWDPKGAGRIGRPRKKWIDGVEDILRDISKYENYLQNHKLFLKQDKQEAIRASPTK
ncbi:Craniofacial development protein 2 like protein [Argiope bruennichi]|uniref:Craniofacial development protein 2 like protein n=1 Tax=Argiope bruennichi TaxID=94029 RepID=A0A8T0E944_ARGBR|nr:Craniofacial development protein 2 like protein [Argiope bruennichi]